MAVRVDLTKELPEFTAAMARLIAAGVAEGIHVTTADFGGIRTEADTTRILEYRRNDYAVALAAAKKAGKTLPPITTWRPIAPFGRSHHNWGAARDVRVVARPAGWTDARALARLGELAPRFGLRWGGLFN